MTDNSTVTKLKDITWGGRITKRYQPLVWAIAKKAGRRQPVKYAGGMVSSSSIDSHQFLDGGVFDSRGNFDAGSGMQWHGEKAKAYILYKLGFDARTLLKNKSIPNLAELEIELKEGANKSA